MRIWKSISTGILIATAAGLGHAQGLLGAVSPSSRSVQTDQSASAFATIINTGQSLAKNCTIAPATGSPVTGFSFQATDPSTNTPVGTANAGVDIPAGGSQTFVFALTPSGTLNARDIAFDFACDGVSPAPVFNGVNTLLLSASNNPVADVITIAATRTKDGVIDIAGQNRFDAFAIAGINIGVAGTFNVTAQSTNAAAPVTALLCETNPATGTCLAAPAAMVSSTLATNAIGTYGVFVLRTGALPFDPAGNRLRLRFTDASALVAGQTGVAARGTGTDVVIGQLVKTANGFKVNGVPFTNGASSYTRVQRAGAPASSSALASGTQVRVQGTKASEAADNVAVDGEVVKGPITALDADTFEVVGQPVLTDQNTIFSDRAFSALTVGDFVEVSGVLDTAGKTHATRIEYVAGGLAQAGNIEVTGTVAANDPAAKTFSINNIVVDYNGASVDDLPGGAPADGQFVEVKSNQDLNGSTLIASKVETGTAGGRDENGEDRVEAGLEAEIEGFVTAFVSPADFSVNDQPVAAGSATVYRGGTVANLALNTRIEVEGTVDDAGVLQASKITFKFPDEVEMAGPVDAINAAARTVTVLGVTVSVPSAADLRDDRDSMANFTFADIQVGDWLDIDGGLRGDTILASKVRRKAAKPVAALQGVVSSFSESAGTLEILGVMIVTTPSTVYKLDNGTVVDKPSFFADLAAGSFTILVEAKGNFSAGTLTATELDLEVED